MKRCPIWAGALGLAAAWMCGGCQTVSLPSAAIAAPGACIYQAGTATQAFNSKSEAVQTAVIEAMADLGIHQVRQTNNVTLLTFEGKTVDGRRASVGVDWRLAPPVVTARFGWLGDEALSRAFMDRVGIRLGSLPPAAIPSEAPSTRTRLPLSLGPEQTAPSVRPLSDSGYRDTPVP